MTSIHGDREKTKFFGFNQKIVAMRERIEFFKPPFKALKGEWIFSD